MQCIGCLLGEDHRVPSLLGPGELGKHNARHAGLDGGNDNDNTMMMMMMIAWMMTPTTLWMHCMMMASGHSSVVCRDPYPIVCCVSTLQTIIIIHRIFFSPKNIFLFKNIFSLKKNIFHFKKYFLLLKNILALLPEQEGRGKVLVGEDAGCPGAIEAGAVVGEVLREVVAYIHR